MPRERILLLFAIIWVGDTAAGKVTRWGDITGPDADIWAFPSAHQKILAGVHRDANPSG